MEERENGYPCYVVFAKEGKTLEEAMAELLCAGEERGGWNGDCKGSNLPAPIPGR